MTDSPGDTAKTHTLRPTGSSSGIGWSMVVFRAWFQARRKSRPIKEVTLDRTPSVEISFLPVASLYSLALSLKRTITQIDSAVRTPYARLAEA